MVAKNYLQSSYISQMKILYVITSLSKGGGERVVAELANEAVKSGNEVLLVAGWKEDPTYLQNKIDKRVTINFISETKKSPYLSLLGWIFRNKKKIQSYDIIHCHLTYGALAGTIAYVYLKKILGNKKIFIVETNHAVGMPVPKFKRWLHSKMLLQRDGIVFMASDEYWTNFMANHKSIKSAIIPNGISIPPVPPEKELRADFIDKNKAAANCKFIVGTVGVFRPDRQPWLYVPLFKAIYEAMGDEVYFVMAGGGAEKERVTELFREQGILNRVLLPGLVTDPVSVMSNMDVYVSVGVGSTAGISMIEAAMCKVPVVGIQLIETHITSDLDWFWSDTDIEKVAKKIVDLLKNEALRNSVVIKQHEYVNEKFTSSAMYNLYDSFYKRVMEG